MERINEMRPGGWKRSERMFPLSSAAFRDGPETNGLLQALVFDGETQDA